MYPYRLLIILLFIFIGTACQQPQQQQNEYHYYPDLNLYYDVTHKNYLYSMDGGNTWDSIDAKTKTIPEALGPKVVLYTTSDSIWKDNEAHRQQYNGYVYNVAEDNGDADTVEAVVTEKKKPVKKVAPTKEPPPQEEKKKKGLGKLLQKIFGKNKDKKADNN